jgi:hypothetical protein
MPLRTAMWLWAVTWCAKWRVLSAAPAGRRRRRLASSNSDDALVNHVRGRVDAACRWTVDRGRQLIALERLLV